MQFWYAENQPWGYDPKDRGGYRVDYIAPGTELELAQPPRKLEVFECCRVEFMQGTSLPNGEWISEFAAAHRDLGELEGYEAIRIDLLVGGMHQMLGHASLVQGPMELECEMVSNGVFCGNATAYKDCRKEFASGALEWRVLLELETDHGGPGWMWGDMGIAYCWIKRDALAAREFEKCWGILQCS